MQQCLQCQGCGSTDIDTDPSNHVSVCTQCGTVLDDCAIVTEVQFAQDSRGINRALAQLVSNEDGFPHSFMFGHGYAFGTESRTISIRNAKENIRNLVSKLELNPLCVETALRFYKLALSRKLTRGRKITHVCAACVYMACRIEETPHMLLDLSDILQISVYELGRTYLKLSSALCIKSPAIDPSLYIFRFASQLQFGKKIHEVAVTASRLVQRMKKDWMHLGRRPSGLCGAALIVAARLHNFNRSVDDVIKVVKVCHKTMRKRLVEFCETPSSLLTLDEFMTIDLEEEQDPPAFKNAQKKLQQELADDGKMKEIEQQVTEIRMKIEKALESTKKRSKYSKFCGGSEPSRDASSTSSSTDVDMFIAENTVSILKEAIPKDVVTYSEISHITPVFMTESASISECADISDSGSFKEPEPTAERIGLKESIEDCMRIPEQSSSVVHDKLDVTGLDDEELDNYLVDNTEYEKKLSFWNKCNADYLLELKEKEERQAKVEENAIIPVKKRQRRPKKGPIQARTAGEAIEKMLRQKKISFKLNYEVLKNLNRGDTISGTAISKPENEVSSEEISAIMRRNVGNRIRPKPPAPVPLSIKKGMSNIIGSTRKREMLAALAEQYNIPEDSPAENIEVDNHESLLESKQMPLETIILEDNNPVPDEEVIEDDDEEEEYGSDDEVYFRSGLPNIYNDERIPDYYGYDDDEYYDDE